MFLALLLFIVSQEFIIQLTFIIIFLESSKVPMNPLVDKVHCCICLEDYINYANWVPILGSRSMYPPPPPPKDWQVNLIHTTGRCSHYVCVYCVKRYLDTYLNDPHDSYNKIKCPHYQCNQTYDAATIVEKAMPNRAAIDRWWLKVYEKTVMDSIGYCPYPNCKGVFELPHEVPKKENHPRFAKCVECQRGLCMNCQNKWHPNKPCGNDHSATPTWQFSQKYHRERERRQQMEIEKKKLARKNSWDARRLAESKSWTRCPKCKEMIEKSKGCDNVKCRCGTRFCHRCGSHTDSNGCKVKCGGFSETKLREFRQHMFQYTND